MCSEMIGIECVVFSHSVISNVQRVTWLINSPHKVFQTFLLQCFPLRYLFVSDQSITSEISMLSSSKKVSWPKLRELTLRYVNEGCFAFVMSKVPIVQLQSLTICTLFHSTDMPSFDLFCNLKQLSIRCTNETASNVVSSMHYGHLTKLESLTLSFLDYTLVDKIMNKKHNLKYLDLAIVSQRPSKEKQLSSFSLHPILGSFCRSARTTAITMFCGICNLIYLFPSKVCLRL